MGIASQARRALPAIRRMAVAGAAASSVFAGVAVATTSGATATDDVAAPVLAAETASIPALVDPVGEVAAASLADVIARSAAVAAGVGSVVHDEIASVPACPVEFADYIDSWGFARSGGRRHKGVDMMAAHGTPIYAPIDGTLRVSNSRLGGLGFYIDGEDGMRLFGSHLQTVTDAGPVSRGDQIGTVGSTGNASASGPHLHFEVSVPGSGTVNPYPFVADWCEGLRAGDQFATVTTDDDVPTDEPVDAVQDVVADVPPVRASLFDGIPLAGVPS